MRNYSLNSKNTPIELNEFFQNLCCNDDIIVYFLGKQETDCSKVYVGNSPRLIMCYLELVYVTREPSKMAQFDWLAISGYWAISHDCDLKRGILLSSRDGHLGTLIKTKTFFFLLFIQLFTSGSVNRPLVSWAIHHFRELHRLHEAFGE